MKIERFPRAEARIKAEAAAQRLAADVRVRLAILFGSAVDEDVDRVRDLDLAISTEPAVSFDDFLALCETARRAAGCPVDLVDLRRASVALAHQVAIHGLCLYADRPERADEFREEAVMRYLDFKPYLDTQWRLSGERLAERLRGAAR